VTRPLWVPPEISVDQPSVARIYDYNLGGAHNFAVDRAVAEQMNRAMPDLPLIQRANRAFLRRAVTMLVSSGVRQFLDLGSGIPTVGSVHEVAQGVAPESRVMYVDVDTVAIAHSQAILADNPLADAVRCDMRQPDEVLAHPRIVELIDFTRPVAVLMVAVLHFVPESDGPAELIARYRDACVPGSYLAISHATWEGVDPGEADEATKVGARNTINVTLRGRTEVRDMFDGFDLVEPGIVFTPEWRPDSDSETFATEPIRAATLAGVGRRR
jgi:SAM-dependent methyltransferase